MRLVLILAVCCAFVSATADAQPRHDGRGGGHGDGQRARGGDTTIIHNYGDRRGGGRNYYRDRRPGYRYDSGRGWYDPSAAIGGAIGGWLYKQFNPPPEPQVIVVPQYQVRDIAWCYRRYKSFDGETYLGYDGYRHPCP